MKGENESRSRVITSLFALCFLLLLSGCAAFQVASEIQTGRYALLAGKPDVALVHFHRAAELDPDYFLNFSHLPQGVWTYVGRANYAAGKLPEARKALQQARLRHGQDYLARLYLGLVLARDGDRQMGVNEIEAGLRGLGDWLEYMERYSQVGRFWDPGKGLRSEIQEDLTMISAKEIDWAKLITSGEWLGREFEEEIDRAREDEIDELYRKDGGDGGGTG